MAAAVVSSIGVKEYSLVHNWAAKRAMVWGAQRADAWHHHRSDALSSPGLDRSRARLGALILGFHCRCLCVVSR